MNIVLRNNLIIFSILIGLMLIANFVKDNDFSILFLLGWGGFFVQSGINFLIGFIKLVKEQDASFYFLSSIVILLIGFPMCGLFIS
jgi:hypothetical protein